MPENTTFTTPEPSPGRPHDGSQEEAAGLSRRASLGEIGAFVAETKRMLNGGSASLADRLAFFEWKADLFARLGEHTSADTAATEAARLRAQLASANERGAA